jgi:rhodanese-related sulfurtransferase
MTRVSLEAAIHDVSPTDLQSMLSAGEVLLVDVREPDERVRQRIEGAVSMPLSSFDPSDVARNGRKVVLHCHSGRRSGQAAQRLIGAGWPEVLHLEGGIQAWKRAGLPVVGNTKAPISIMRQVQITAGSLVLVGLILGVLVSPWLLGLSAFIGAGLVFSGASGTCGMAAMLSRMPWNRALREACKHG